MKISFLRFGISVVIISLSAFLFGCDTTRSISDSGYQRDRNWRVEGLPHRGELKEFEVLGIEQTDSVTEAQIAQARAARKKIHLKKGSSILLIQSGATYPDAPMIAHLQNFFTVVPFTGVREGTNENSNYSKSLRLAAARGGCDTVICYWGILESAKNELTSKTISWVPIVGNVVPDETQHMRIRLKMALVDVETGSWTMFSPQAFEDKATSAGLTRKSSDQKQVEKLKEKAYEATAANLVETFSN
jgi:hypothetical protein